MYTTGDVFEALGEDVMVRSRDTIVDGPREQAGGGPCGRVSPTVRRRQVVSVVELQVTWVGRYTHLLAWLDFVQM